MRILLVSHHSHVYDARRYTYGLILGLAQQVDVSIAEWERMESPSARSAAAVAGVDLANVDICMTYMRFRFLMLKPFDWSGYDGPRVLMEHDAWESYSLAHPQLWGSYARIYHRDRFDLMICTGRYTTSKLRDDGVNAVWLPKAYNPENFRDLGGTRAGVCTFGTGWPSRRALEARLRGRITNVSGPYETLNERLNRFAGGLVCNMPGRAPLGRVGRRIQRTIPSFVRVYPAVEPMIKTFEMAGAGCAPIVDHLDELSELGFIDGQTCLTYRTFDEAVDLVGSVDDRTLIGIGHAAEELVRTRHTWRHRAEAIPAILGGAVITRPAETTGDRPVGRKQA